jgi:hypothetical protein
MNGPTRVIRGMALALLVVAVVMPTLAYGQGRGQGRGHGQGPGQGQGPSGTGDERGRGDEVRPQLSDDDTDAVSLCHLTGNGDYVFISVNRHAVRAHRRHGDLVGVTSAADCPGANAEREEQAMGAVHIEGPARGATISGLVTLTGLAADCANGTPAQQVRIYRGGITRTLLGTATLATGLRDLAPLCDRGLSGLAPLSWSFTFDTTQLPNRATQLTAEADVSSGVVRDSVVVNILNGTAAVPSGGCNPYSPTPNPLFPNNMPCPVR